MFKTVLCLLMAALFTPAGVWTLRAAFSVTDAPHVFVMLMFSGSLMILIGLAGLGGLYFRLRPEAPREEGGGADPPLNGEEEIP
ncbi:MAG: hypothetical protein LBQ12_05585 [Deltaproteobacteria bacterium]|jgi:hypothetical protein|nr:hypothetical protein [Deltaproteobacteria bacterium]